MNSLCKHDWKEIARTQTTPFRGEQITIKQDEICLKILLGTTSILWECQICQKTKKEELLGREEHEE